MRPSRPRRFSTPPARSCNSHPAEVLHVGDDPELDVIGAQRAGLRCAWLNRTPASWSALLPPDPTESGAIEPDLIVRDLAELADALDKFADAA